MKLRFALVLSLPILASACGGGSTATEPAASYEGPIASTDVVGGEAIWSARCASCHTEASDAYGPRVTDLGMNPPRMRRQIREGEGRMPGFDTNQISADDLEKLLAYLGSIRGVATE